MKDLPKYLKAYLLTCLLLTSLSILLSVNFISDPFSSTVYVKEYPGRALDFIKSDTELDNLKIFNNYAWGGYMIFKDPTKKIFIDGRLPQVYYKKHSFLEEYLAFFQSDEEIKEKLKEYDIGLVLLPAKDKRASASRLEKFLFYLKEDDLNPPNNFRKYLNNSADWQIIYNDEASVIYKRIK